MEVDIKNYEIVEVTCVEQLEDFNDEYVYEVNNMIHNLNNTLRRSIFIYYRRHDTK